MNNYILLIGLLVIVYFLYKSNEQFKNEERNKECSRLEINNAIYGYNVNSINKGAR